MPCQIRISCTKIHVISEQILSFINKLKQSAYSIEREERSRLRGRERQAAKRRRARKKEQKKGKRNGSCGVRLPPAERRPAWRVAIARQKHRRHVGQKSLAPAARARGKFVRQLFILKYARAGMHLGHGKCGLLREETGGGEIRGANETCARVCVRAAEVFEKEEAEGGGARLPCRSRSLSSFYVRVRRFSASFWCDTWPTKAEEEFLLHRRRS